jgi:hypothetical protein
LIHPEIGVSRADLTTCEPSECIDKASRDGRIVQTGTHSNTSAERLDPRCHFSIAGRLFPIPTYPLPIVSLSQPRPSLSTSHHRPTYEGGQLPIRWVDGRLTACPRKTAESFIKARTKTQGLPYHLCWSTLMISFGGFSRAVCGDWFVAVSEQGVFFSEGTCVILGNGGMEPFYVLW